MIADEVDADPQCGEGFEHEDGGCFFVASLCEFDGVDDEGADAVDRRAEAEDLAGHAHAVHQRIGLLDLASQLVSEMRLQLIGLDVDRSEVLRDVLEQPAQLHRPKVTFSRPGLCARKTMSPSSTFLLPPDDVIDIRLIIASVMDHLLVNLSTITVI
jgi:hypothetical protein